MERVKSCINAKASYSHNLVVNKKHYKLSDISADKPEIKVNLFMISVYKKSSSL